MSPAKPIRLALLGCGTVGTEQGRYLASGDHERAHRKQHEECRDADVDNALGGLQGAVAGTDQWRDVLIGGFVCGAIDRWMRLIVGGEVRAHPMIMRSVARYGE